MVRTTFGGEERFRRPGPAMLGGVRKAGAVGVEAVHEQAKSPRPDFVLAGSSAPRTGVRASARYAHVGTVADEVGGGGCDGCNGSGLPTGWALLLPLGMVLRRRRA